MNLNQNKVELKLDWCSYQAAKYAVEHWHYSKTMPAGKLIKIGVWEEKKYIGLIIFGRGANNNIGTPFKLKQTEVCELVRIALNNHKNTVTRILSISFLLLKKYCPCLKLCVSYADPEQGHFGGVYQGGNWIYTGISQAQREVIVNGKIMHKRSANALFGTIKGLEKSKMLFKHKYLLPLDIEMRKQIELLRKPYPKRATSIENDAAGFQPEKGGVIPTVALH